MFQEFTHELQEQSSSLVKKLPKATGTRIAGGLLTLFLSGLVASMLGVSLISNGYQMLPNILHRGEMGGSMMKTTGQKQYDQPSDAAAWLRNLIPFIDKSGQSPRIIKTPKSWNVIYDLPGYSADEISITTDEDDVNFSIINN